MIDHLLWSTGWLLLCAMTILGLAFGLFLRRANFRSYPRSPAFPVLDLKTGKKRNQSIMNSAGVKLTVVVPAYREETRIGPMLSDTLTYLERRNKQDHQFTAEIIVVDDGSPDKTSKCVEDIYKRIKPVSTEVGLIKFPRNQGKGAAISEGILAARGEYILFSDADGATKIEELEKLEAVQAGLVCGSRSLSDQTCTVERHPVRMFMMIAFKCFLSLWGVKTVKDTQCGFKLLSRPAARLIIPNLRLNRWIFDVELIHLAEQFGLEIREVPVNWVEIDGSKLCLAVDSVKMAVDLVFMRMAYFLGLWKIHTVKRAD